MLLNKTLCQNANGAAMNVFLICHLLQNIGVLANIAVPSRLIDYVDTHHTLRGLIMV